MKIYAISISLMVILSCGSTKTTKQAEAKKTITASENLYRFHVSFISIGSGTDGAARKKFLQFIKDYEASNNTKISMEEISWGREGERDYCLKLAELQPEAQKKFINDIKDLLKESGLIRYSENIACHRQGQ